MAASRAGGVQLNGTPERGKEVIGYGICIIRRLSVQLLASSAACAVKAVASLIDPAQELAAGAVHAPQLKPKLIASPAMGGQRNEVSWKTALWSLFLFGAGLVRLAHARPQLSEGDNSYHASFSFHEYCRYRQCC